MASRFFKLVALVFAAQWCVALSLAAMPTMRCADGSACPAQISQHAAACCDNGGGAHSKTSTCVITAGKPLDVIVKADASPRPATVHFVALLDWQAPAIIAPELCRPTEVRNDGSPISLVPRELCARRGPPLLS